MKKNILSFVMVIFSATLFSQPIQVTILDSQPITGITSIQYEFSGPVSSYDISVEVSFDGDPYQPVPVADLSGDLNNVAPGIRNITWNGAASFPNHYHLQTLIRITATPNIVCGDQITDIDGNVYNTVLIGTQCWMKENLKTTKDADGNAITRYCYDNDPSNCAIYGGLYTWTTAMNGAASSDNVPSGVQGICPDGWHLPGDLEWTKLTYYVRSQSGFKCYDEYTSYIGKSLAAQTNWQTSTNTCAVGNNLTVNNATGFSGLPGGARDIYGFYYVGMRCYWWTSTEYDYDFAHSSMLDFDYPDVGQFMDEKVFGLSVRCLRD
jgi:uncharacterized protein (TIGR02145 family)